MGNTKNLETLALEFKKLVECDTARISKPSEKMFFIIGFNKETKNETGQWLRNGEPFDFSYLEEKVIASGETVKELRDSILEYNRLSKMTWEEYILEKAAA